jgi:hypothetical protein
VEVPPRGFHDYACQCIRGRIHKKDEIESLRVVLAVNRNRTGQKDENPPDAVRTERIRESYLDVDSPDEDNERTETRPNRDSEFHAASSSSVRFNHPTEFPKLQTDPLPGTAADFLYDLSLGEKVSFQSALTCRSMSANARRNRRNYVGRRKCNSIKSNLARGFKP